MQLEESKNTICIQGIKQVFTGVYKMHPLEGPVFFVRDKYFGEEAFKKIIEDFDSLFYNPEKGESYLHLDEDKSLRLIDASEAYIAERYAMGLLNRSEQSRFLLFQKLVKKGYTQKHSNEVLDFLESEGFVSDARYAQSWLSQRMRSKKESRTKLYQELCSRSIKSEIAKEAVDKAFEEISEDEILKDLIESYRMKQFSDEKILKKCIYYGFSLKEIKNYIKTN